jgi:uncharacterized protein (DUF1800 family)
MIYLFNSFILTKSLMHAIKTPSRPAFEVLDPRALGVPQPDTQAQGGSTETCGIPGLRVSALSAMGTVALAACGGGDLSTLGNNAAPVSDKPATWSVDTGGSGGGAGSGTDILSESSNSTNTVVSDKPSAESVNTSNPADSTPIAKPRLTEQEAARFLAQASFGGNYAQVKDVMAKGLEAWLDTELAKPWDEADSHYNWIAKSGFLDAGQSSKLGMENTLWRKLMSAPDVLRQRIAFALSQIFVVSIEGLGAIAWRNVAALTYMDLLEKNAFGNFADLLKAVSLSPAMGTYLNMKGSVKATGTNAPDENYAREVMQLFTIGLYQLNADGSRKLQNGKPIETYQQADVTNLAAILTGWNFATVDKGSNLNNAMTHTSSAYSIGTKYYLGGTIASAATGPEALHTVLDYLAHHDNVGPFIGRQLIQRLVCSNPSPAYIGRVSAAFTTTVNGKRGDLKTVIKAVLLDPEARSIPTDPRALAQYGKLREPVLRLVQWARTFNAKPSDLNVRPSSTNSWVGPWNIGDLSGDVTGIGQSPLRSPSVFNFYRPGYVPQQGEMGANSITAPEFQICNEVTVAKYLNFLNTTIGNGRNDVKADYSADYALAKDAIALVNRYALLLAASALSDSSKKTIADAVATQAANDDAGCLLRIKAAIFLIIATPEYIIQK